MSDVVGLNWPTFASAAATLRAEGYDVVSPHELEFAGETSPGSLPWTEYLRRDLCAMLECDAIALLPGWTQSRGARLEFQTACRVALTLYTYEYGRLVPIETDPPL